VLYRVDKLGNILIAFFSPIQFCNDLRIFVTTLTRTRKSGSYFFLNPPKLVTMNLSDFTEHRGRRGHRCDRMIV
jgi:hypothetical protein